VRTTSHLVKREIVVIVLNIRERECKRKRERKKERRGRERKRGLEERERGQKEREEKKRERVVILVNIRSEGAFIWVGIHQIVIRILSGICYLCQKIAYLVFSRIFVIASSQIG
jgi:hypothetical protein